VRARAHRTSAREGREKLVTARRSTSARVGAGVARR